MANATDIEAIFEIITQVCSFLDYNLLEHLIDILGNEEDKKRMQKYYEKFDEYVRRRVIECPNIEPADTSKWSDIYIKLDSKLENEKFTINQLQEFHFKISEILDVSLSAIRFCCTERGCIRVNWQIPHFVKQAVFPLCSQQEMLLEQQRVIHFSCENYEYSVQVCIIYRCE